MYYWAHFFLSHASLSTSFNRRPTLLSARISESTLFGCARFFWANYEKCQKYEKIICQNEWSKMIFKLDLICFLGNNSDYSLQTCFFELPKPWTRQALKSSQGQRQKKQNMIDFYRNNLHLYSTFFCTPCKNNRKKLNLIHLSKKFQNFWGFCLTSQFYPNHPIHFNLV